MAEKRLLVVQIYTSPVWGGDSYCEKPEKPLGFCIEKVKSRVYLRWY